MHFFAGTNTEKVFLEDHQDLFYFDQIATRMNEVLVEGMSTWKF